VSLVNPMFDLETIYVQSEGVVFMTGIQALVRVPLVQRRLDRALGLDTAGLVTGYRGSPLGSYDLQLWKASKHLADHNVVFQPGLNEDLAATALWGAQMHRAFGPTRADGVFGIWYGKGPGVDRSGDVFRNANILGTSALGGVLVVAGDDHAAQSSMFPHQTDGIFQSVMMPILQPANVADILHLGIAGIALSRFSGLWVALKAIAEVVESASTLGLNPPSIFTRPDAAMPPHGLNWDPRLTWPAQRFELERRLIEERLPAALAWARHNRIDRPVIAANAKRRICIVTVGKSHQDTMQAIADLGLSDTDASDLGIAVYKVAMSWPLDTMSLLQFAERFEEILVVEEKQPIVENQIKTALFHRESRRRPRVLGKTDESGRPLLRATMELDPLEIARALIGRLDGDDTIGPLRHRVATLEQRSSTENASSFPVRKPFFCSGCPHNRSTRTPDGSIAGGGIGCHVMALSQASLKTTTFSQMGGEGLQWVGAAPFSKTNHIFQNLGDGTYQHSGILAIRAAVAAGTNITFKILYNDAVAMTGGQPADGVIDPARITRQLAAEGVSRIVLLSDDPESWKREKELEAGVVVRDRDALDEVQRELRKIAGVSAIVYVQTCAAEKRRRRKRKQLSQAHKRLFINTAVCEGCGDCSIQSNCIAIEPLATEYGQKRRINQSSCNDDLSCVKGFCPSFVELEGAVPNKPDPTRLIDIETNELAVLTAPPSVVLTQPFNIYVAGIGGSGVLTLGALLGLAAYLDGMGASVLDFTGLAQKNGAVVSQVRIAASGNKIHAARIGPGEIDLLLGADVVVAASPDALRKIAKRTAIVLNTDETPTADIVTDRDTKLPTSAMMETVFARGEQGRGFTLEAIRLSQALFGDPVSANTLLLGYAWQKGLVPLSEHSIKRAIELNGAAVELNKQAFGWGRIAAVNREFVLKTAGIIESSALQRDQIRTLVERCDRELVAYQGPAYAERYRRLVDRVIQTTAGLGREGEKFVRAVAVNAHRLMAYKDEYEVARLYSDGRFFAELKAQFAGQRRVAVWLAPPLFSSADPITGRPTKRKFGPWIFKLFFILAKFKFLRGSKLDPFGHSAERKAERRLVAEYFATIEAVSGRLDAASLPIAIELAELPQNIRGFGPVKHEAIIKTSARQTALRAQLIRPARSHAHRSA
jgi:indolepyruvate ferredoxin oxidoreductase